MRTEKGKLSLVDASTEDGAPLWQSNKQTRRIPKTNMLFAERMDADTIQVTANSRVLWKGSLSHEGALRGAFAT